MSMSSDSKQDTFGFIHNAVVDEFKARGILPSSDPSDHKNVGITDSMGVHLQTQLANKHFGDGEKAVADTLKDLTGMINNRRENEGLAPVPKEQVAEAVSAGWEKAITARPAVPQQGHLTAVEKLLQTPTEPAVVYRQ